ncbi:MAG: antitoxin MazE family protein [Pseudomonadota bacterium]
MKKYRERLRGAGLRPVQIWVPDKRSGKLAAEVRRQSLLVAADHRAESETDKWIEQAADTEGWEWND